MKRKHMESHWKELVAEQAARKEQNGVAAAPKSTGKKKAGKEVKPEAAAQAKAKTEDIIDDDEKSEAAQGRNGTGSITDVRGR